MSGKEELKKEIETKKRKLAELKAKREARRNAGGRRAARPARAARAGGSPRRAAARSSRVTGGGGVNLDAIAQMTGGPTRKAELSMDEMTESVNINPAEKNYYDKLIQCDIDGDNRKKNMGEGKTLQEKEDELELDRQRMNKLKALLYADRQKYDKDVESNEPDELDHDSRRQLENNKEFRAFITPASKMLTNALDFCNYDITIDYTASDDILESKDEMVICRHTFKDLRTVNRAVTSMHWDPNDGERMIASYSGQDDPMTLEPDGTVLIWNTNSQQPEQYFSCNSTVLTAQFHPSNDSWIIGGCRSGQVVIWDVRVKRSSPQIRTSLSHGHTYPVYALDCIAVAANVNNIVSVSTEGMMCMWSEDNLHDPESCLSLNDLKNSDEKDSQDEITTTSFDYPLNAAGQLVLGSDEGNLYKAKTSDENGIYKTITKAHDAPITSVQFHKNEESPEYMRDLFLTSSYDWTVKLWNGKTNKLVYTFESARDYVFDVQWSPIHPAVFATGDGTGKLDVWNLSGEADVPAYSVPVEKDKGAISRLRWAADGKHIAAGLSTGNIYILEVKGDLSEKPSEEDANNFYTAINKKANSSI